jgi:hypothetical protein
MSQKPSDSSCLPLTWDEHREYHRIGKAAFEARHGIECAAEAAELYGEWQALQTTARRTA